MAVVRRARHVFFRLEDEPFPDIPALLRGQARSTTIRRWWVTSVLTSRSRPMSERELALLRTISRDEWTKVRSLTGEGASEAEILDLARGGVLVTDSDDPELRALRLRDDRIRADRWNPWAAAYHFLTHWGGVDLGIESADSPQEARMMAEFVEEHGNPPWHFHSVRSDAAGALPGPAHAGPFYELLSRRQTSRVFDDDRPITAHELATLLYWVFGFQGTTRITDGFVSLKKTSPSGGGMHPTEAYLLVRFADGIAPGLYHYDVGHHALERIRLLNHAAAADAARVFTAGQGDLAGAQVLVLMTSRFARAHWKYPDHERVYAVLLMDVAHLSQTLYLMATELGLGAFVTAAINAEEIERALGIDGAAEGALAICGTGRVPDPPPPSDVVPYRPWDRG